MQPTTLPNGKTDPCGGVFALLPGQPYSPQTAFVVGPPGGPHDMMVRCPKDAIDPAIGEWLAAWWQARAVGLPLVAGGFVDQPLIARLAFPLWEREYAADDRFKERGGDAMALTLVMRAMLSSRGVR